MRFVSFGFALLGLSATASAGPLTDLSDVVLEGEVTGVRERLHELVPGLPVRVFTVRVDLEIKGGVPDEVELILPGGNTEDGGYVMIVGAPDLSVGDHVLAFCRLRSLGDSASVAEPNALRLTGHAGIYHRTEDAVPLAEDGWGNPLPLEAVDGTYPIAIPLAPSAEDEEALPAAEPAVEWASVVSAVMTEVALASKEARPPLFLAEVTP